MFILNPDEHIKKAEKNFSYIQNIFKKHCNECPDWVCVVSFYSALHYVCAILLKQNNVRKTHHEERNQQVSLLHPEIEIEYLGLYDHGRNARYDKISNSPESGDAEYAITHSLPRIRDYVLSRV